MIRWMIASGVAVVICFSALGVEASESSQEQGADGGAGSGGSITFTAGSGARAIVAAPAGHRPVIQIALLLDTSNSMDGLIGQAKTQLWKIVNQFDAARHNGLRPIVEVALYHYGTPALGADNGFVRQLLAFTTDLDLVSEKLFALQTNGGDEYCGTVIQAAVRDLGWSRFAPDYRAIFIAGNEPFNQGEVDYRQSCREALDRDIVVNTIFCGQSSEGIHTFWKDGADLTDGSYMSIDQDAEIVHINAPQDDELIELNKKLNGTYLGYGVHGEAGAARQQAQDVNAASFEGALVNRITTKSSSSYSNASWDLIDAVQQGGVKLEEIKPEDLPEEMRQLSPQQQQELLNAKAKERSDVQARIRQLTQEREAYVAQQMKAHAAAASANTLDEAVIGAVRQQVQKKNYIFETPPAPGLAPGSAPRNP